jgi:hypothetical protein
VLMWAARSPVQAARGDAGFVGPALFGTVALTVAVGGRITSAHALRYQGIFFPRYRRRHRLSSAPRSGRVRCAGAAGLPYLYLVITVGGLAVALMIPFHASNRSPG